MIISLGRKYIFVHAPKTAGTSMALALEGRAMKDDIMLGDTPKAIKRRRRLKEVKTHGRLWKHSTLTDIDGLISPEQLNDLFAFTLVRNPWDRMVSYYHWLKQQSFAHPAVTLAKSADFQAFVCAQHTRDTFRNTPAQHYMTDINGQERCDAYIRIEHFDQDVTDLSDHLGFDLNLEHVNKSTRREGYQSYYNAESQKSVCESCAVDIERFGYSFD